MNKNLSQISNNLPTTPGVYIFENSSGYPLYIGKSINIKDRVKSHIYNAKNNLKEAKICQSSSNISFIQTAGELGALLRESFLVKQLSPLYNRKLRRYRTLIGINETVNNYGYKELSFKEISSEISPDQLNNFLYISHSLRDLKYKMQQLVEKHMLCSKLMGLEYGKGSCFQYFLKRCSGACVQKENTEQYNRRFENAITEFSFKKWPYPGEVTVYEQHEDFEEEIIINNWYVDESQFAESKFKSLYMIKEKYFDLDSYRILRSFLINNGGAVMY